MIRRSTILRSWTEAPQHRRCRHPRRAPAIALYPGKFFLKKYLLNILYYNSFLYCFWLNVYYVCFCLFSSGGGGAPHVSVTLMPNTGGGGTGSGCSLKCMYIPAECSEDRLRETFSHFGRVVSVKTFMTSPFGRDVSLFHDRIWLNTWQF